MNIKSYVLSFFSLVCLNVLAQSPGLDPSFGSGGRFIHQNPLINTGDYGDCLAYDSDGRILVGLRSGGVMRLMPNAVVDSSFGINGFFPNPLCEGALEIISLPNGKILYSGINYEKRARIYRLNPNGQPDSTFGNNGVASLFIANSKPSNSIRSITDMIVQPDGKTLFVTTNGDIDPKYQTMIRLNEDGSLDPEFGISGIRKFYGDQDQPLGLAELAINSNGEILVGFNYFQNSHYNMLVSKFSPTGHLDTLFGTNGFIHLGSGTVHKVFSLEDGHFEIFGQKLDSFLLPSLFKYWNDGSLDSSFATNGIAQIPNSSYVTNSNSCNGFLQSDGKILVTYGFKNLFRFNTDGSIDTSLGINGLLPRPTTKDQFFDALQQPDGKIIATTYYAPMPDTNVISILRYLSSNFVGSIESTSPKYSVLLYPNPVSSPEFTVAYDLPNKSKVNMTLVNMNGQKVVQLDFPSQEPGRYEKTVPLPSGLPNGNYLLTIQTQHGNANVQISIIH